MQGKLMRVADKSAHYIVNVRGMKVAELTELEDSSTAQTPPHCKRGILEAHGRIPPRENGRLHGSRTMREVP